ncbi:MAG: NADH-quinone oxidoreductase subunit NuoH [Anaerolineales bacterium]|nr:NADH-quinone oxidoreductase subunit NuoH [Anaerolineales bacterium]
MDKFEIANLFISIGRVWDAFLVNLGLAEPWISFIDKLLGAIILTAIPVVIVVFTIMGERKIIGRFQDRLGPNRVGPFGFLQTIPDVMKLLTKEIITPDKVDKVMYNIAPLLSVAAVILIWAVLPFANNVIGVDLDIGALYFVAVSSLGTLAILMAGWSSNNKYALVAAFRVVAQLISYEVPMVFALLVPVLLAGTMQMNQIVQAQSDGWFVILAPVSMLLFFISSTAEVGRSPFDLLEADSEIVAGFNIEYSGMKFAMFFLGEWIHAFTFCAVVATLFFGGWRGPFVDDVPALGVLYFFIKMFAIYFVHIWIRTTMPRIRIDHMLSFNWKFLVPLSLVNLVVMSLTAKLIEESSAMLFSRGAILLGVNLLMVVGTFYALSAVGRREREKDIMARKLEPVTGGVQR